MKTKMQALFSTIALLTITNLSAQTTAMNFSGVDCNGSAVDLFADLDAGKAVVLFFYMPNCGSCPPHAKKIQEMGDNINSSFPGMFKAYAFPYQNSTSCTYSQTWVTNNNLSLFAPMDSGAVQVAYYGGFAMPTTVLLGGLNKDVLFLANANNSNSPSDTTAMKDAILTLFSQNQLSLNEKNSFSAQVYPNPVNQILNIELNPQEHSTFTINVVSMDGRIVLEEKNIGFDKGNVKKEINVSGIEPGNYLLNMFSEKEQFSRVITIK